MSFAEEVVLARRGGKDCWSRRLLVEGLLWVSTNRREAVALKTAGGGTPPGCAESLSKNLGPALQAKRGELEKLLLGGNSPLYWADGGVANLKGILQGLKLVFLKPDRS